MSSEKPQRVRRILELALRLSPADRAARLAEVCAGDSELQHEIEGLIDLYERSPRDASDPAPPSSPTTFSPDLAQDALPSPTPTPRPAMGAGAGTSWGGFVLIEELGRGGFGVVYRAWDATLKRDVALKIIDVRRLHGVSEDTVLREGQLMARIRHPNVVTVYSAQRIAAEVGLTMEYIKGRTLAMLIAEDGPLGAHEAALIGMSLCDALTAVHRLGLVHRDLKASNVMREHGGRIVLMDFGAGRELGAAADGRAQVLGTPVYMAPEVLLGGRGTATSDLYSLGVLMYNLVTADYPVRGARMDQIRLAHLAGDRTSLAERRPELPAPFVDAVETALSTDVAVRPQTSVAFKRLLADAMPYLPPDSGGRRRKKAPVTPRPAPATPTPPTPAAATRIGFGTAALLAVSGALVLASALGFVTTVEFNAALGRTGAFAAESPLSYPLLGARSVFGSVIYVLLAFLLLMVVAAIVRGLSHVVPAFGRLVASLKRAASRAVEKTGLGAPDALAQALPVLGLVSLGLILWRFLPFVLALFGPINNAAPATLQLLSSRYEPLQLLFRRTIELVIVLLGAGLLFVVNRRRRGAPVSVAHVVATAAVLVVALVLLVLPWRLVFNSEFPEATLDGRPCFVIGEAGTELLVHCPGDPASARNTVVARGDRRLQLSARISNLFDAYSTPSLPPTQR